MIGLHSKRSRFFNSREVCVKKYLKTQNSKIQYSEERANRLRGVSEMEWSMSSTIIHPLLSIAAGIIILVWPTILNYVIAIWLILTGVLSYLAIQ